MIKEKHGMARTPMYRIWQNIKDRCMNDKNPHFHNYGGRGISMSDVWKESFSCFHADIGDRPSKFHTLERIDNDGNYEIGNVRWATRKEQAHNMRKNVNLTFGGRTQVLAAWAEEIDLVPSTLWYRLFTAKMSVEEALTTPRRGGRPRSHTA